MFPESASVSHSPLRLAWHKWRDRASPCATVSSSHSASWLTYFLLAYCRCWYLQQSLNESRPRKPRVDIPGEIWDSARACGHEARQVSSCICAQDLLPADSPLFTVHCTRLSAEGLLFTAHHTCDCQRKSSGAAECACTYNLHINYFNTTTTFYNDNSKIKKTLYKSFPLWTTVRSFARAARKVNKVTGEAKGEEWRDGEKSRRQATTKNIYVRTLFKKQKSLALLVNHI